MKIQGLSFCGLNLTKYGFTPISVSYTAKRHKYGFDATWSHCTDTYEPTVSGHGFDAEINALKYNLQMTVFAHQHFTSGYISQLLGFYGSGRSGIGSYDNAGYLYAEEVLTLETYPAWIASQYNWIKTNFGFYPSSASYSYGDDTLKTDLAAYYLGVRNSGWNVDDYDYDIADTSSFEITTRQADMEGERSTVLAQCATALGNAITNGGWYRDFTHWHNCTGTMIGDYFASQRAEIGANNVICLDFGTALEYMKFRQNLTSLEFLTDGTNIVISANVSSGLIAQDIYTTLSVEIDLTGTVLAGLELKSNYGLQKVSGNTYIVEVPITGCAMLTPDVSGVYLDFSLPTITTLTTTSVVTDRPCRVSVFTVLAGQDIGGAELLYRDNTIAASHVLDLSDVNLPTYDVYVGCITAEKQSVLQKIV